MHTHRQTGNTYPLCIHLQEPKTETK